MYDLLFGWTLPILPLEGVLQVTEVPAVCLVDTRRTCFRLRYWHVYEYTPVHAVQADSASMVPRMFIAAVSPEVAPDHDTMRTWPGVIGGMARATVPLPV